MTANGFRIVVLGSAIAVALSSGTLNAAESQLSEQAQNLIAPVFEAFENTDRLIGLLPPPGDVTEELIRMRSIDRAGRDRWETIDLSALPETEREAAFDIVWDEIHRRDVQNQTRLKELIPENGWFTLSEYGIDGTLSAFQIVQHASNDPELQRRALASMEPLLGTDEIDGRAYAVLYDRVAMEEGRYQRFGSQMICRDGHWTLYPTEELNEVDERRRDVGFDLSLSDNIARFAERPPCSDNYDGPLPE
jgi:hypothetical protein